MAKYDGNYISDGMKEIIEQFEADYESAVIEVTIDGDFNNPDILDIMNFLGDTGDKQYCDKLVRQCILGKNVNFTLDGDHLGSIRMNGVNDSWSVFPVINDYPASYKALSDTVSVHLLKKLKLPRKKGTGPRAVPAVATQS